MRAVTAIFAREVILAVSGELSVVGIVHGLSAPALPERPADAPADALMALVFPSVFLVLWRLDDDEIGTGSKTAQLSLRGPERELLRNPLEIQTTLRWHRSMTHLPALPLSGFGPHQFVVTYDPGDGTVAELRYDFDVTQQPEA